MWNMAMPPLFPERWLSSQLTVENNVLIDPNLTWKLLPEKWLEIVISDSWVTLYLVMSEETFHCPVRTVNTIYQSWSVNFHYFSFINEFQNVFKSSMTLLDIMIKLRPLMIKITLMVRICSFFAALLWPQSRRCSHIRKYQRLFGEGSTLNGGGTVPPSSK